MPMFFPTAIRTFALVGHGASGKTTLAEALLAKAGAIPVMGSVERGLRSAISKHWKKITSIRSLQRWFISATVIPEYT